MSAPCPVWGLFSGAVLALIACSAQNPTHGTDGTTDSEVETAGASDLVGGADGAGGADSVAPASKVIDIYVTAGPGEAHGAEKVLGQCATAADCSAVASATSDR